MTEPTGDVVLYTTDDGLAQVKLRAVDGSAWLTQAQLAELFQVTPQAITQHIGAIYKEDELLEAATCNDYLQVRSEGGREVQRTLRHYNLEVILAVGYRVQSVRGTQFRRCDYAEDQAKRRQVVTMAEWADKLDAFLQFNDRALLTNAGAVSAAVAKKLAEGRYSDFNERRKAADAAAADAADITELERLVAPANSDHGVNK